MRTGRPKHKIPRVRWDVYIRADLAAQVELIITDPMREKAKYGARSNLIEAVLEKWLKDQRAAAQALGIPSVVVAE